MYTAGNLDMEAQSYTVITQGPPRRIQLADVDATSESRVARSARGRVLENMPDGPGWRRGDAVLCKKRAGIDNRLMSSSSTRHKGQDG